MSHKLRMGLTLVAENHYRKSILDWAKRHGITVRSGQYVRRAASGTTSWWCLEAKEPKGYMLLVHGTGDDAFFPFAKIIRELVTRGISVMLFDLDGHGRTSTTLFDERTVQSSISDAWSRLPSRLPKHILGFSLGATLALNAAKQGGIDPDSLILIAPAVRLELVAARIWPEMKGLASDVFWNVDDGTSLWARFPAFGPFGRKHYPIRLERSGQQSANYMKRAQQAIERCNLTAMRQFRSPVLVIYGENDLIVPALPRETWRAMAPKSQMRVIADAAHFVLPYHPESIEAIVAWLRHGLSH